MNMNTSEVYRNIISEMRYILQKELSKTFFIAQVTSIERFKENYVLKVVRLNDGSVISGVKVVSVGIGNLKGVIKFPEVNDLGIVLNIFGEFFWLGNIFDFYSVKNDVVPDLGKGMVLQATEGGSFIFLKENNEILLKSKSGFKIIFLNDRVRIMNKDRYGVEITSDGKVNIYGIEINFYNTPMSE